MQLSNIYKILYLKVLLGKGGVWIERLMNYMYLCELKSIKMYKKRFTDLMYIKDYGGATIPEFIDELESLDDAGIIIKYRKNKKIYINTEMQKSYITSMLSQEDMAVCESVLKKVID